MLVHVSARFCFPQAKVQWDITGFEGTYKMGAMAEVPNNGDDQSAPASVDDLLVRFLYRWCCKWTLTFRVPLRV